MAATLLDALRHRTPAQLAALLTARPDLAQRPVPATLSEVAARAGRWASQHPCLNSLDTLGIATVEVLCLLPAPASADDVATFLNVDDATPEVVAATFATLADLALVVLDDQGRAKLVGEVRGRVPFPARLGAPAATLLDRLDKRSLDSIAGHLGVKAQPSKAKAVAAIAAALADADHVVSILKTAPPDALARLDAVASVEGPTVSMVGGWYGPSPRSRPRDVEWGVQRGLLVPRDATFAEMPRELGLLLRLGRPYPELVCRPPDLAPEPVAADVAARDVAHRAAAAIAAVQLVIDECDANPIPMLQSGGVGVRELRRLAKVLDTDPSGAGFVIELAYLAGLIAVDYRLPALMATTDVDGWRMSEPAAQWSRIVDGWWTADRWPSAAGVDDPMTGKPIPALGHQPDAHRNAAGQRHHLLEVLRNIPPGAGVAADHLAAAVRWRRPGLWKPVGHSSERLAQWVIDEAAALGIVSRTPHIALSDAGRFALFGGGSSLAAARELLPAPGTDITIQADLTAMAAGSLRHDIAADLALMADVESRGAATVYRFGEATLRRAIDAGWSADAVLRFLEVHATKGVPQALSYLVTDIARRHGSLRVGQAVSYVRSEDPSLLAEVLRHRKLTKLGLHLLAPTVAISQKPIKDVIAALRANGFLPAEEDSAGGVVLGRTEAERIPPTPRVTSPAGVGGSAPPLDANAVHDLATALLQPAALGPGPERWGEDIVPDDAEVERPNIHMLLQLAAQTKRRVDIGYHDAEGTFSMRTIEPLAVEQHLVEAYCHMRQDERVFAIDRIRWAVFLAPDAAGVSEAT